MVEVIITYSWPDPSHISSSSPFASRLHQATYAGSVPGPGQRYALNVTSALSAIVDPVLAAEVVNYLKIQLYPVHRQTPPSGGSSGGGSDGQQGHSTKSADINHDSGSSRVEQEVADEAETPSSQQHTPSRSRAAVLLMRAAACVYGKVEELRKLALSEGNEELRELLSDVRFKRSVYWERKLLGEF
jgi:hypothetical protein